LFASCNPVEQLLEAGLPCLQHVRVEVVRQLLLREDEALKLGAMVLDRQLLVKSEELGIPPPDNQLLPLPTLDAVKGEDSVALNNRLGRDNVKLQPI